MNKVSTIGIDLAKRVFQLHGVDAGGQVVLRKRLKRAQLLTFLANVPGCVVAMEACGSSHYWGREIAKLGHEVKLISPQYVKPYRQGNKNDGNDAEAICEAARRPGMRFVAVKTVAQQETQAVHRMREQVVKSRTALVNQIRGLLAEFGVVIPKGMGQVRRAVPGILEAGENGLTDLMRELIAQAYQRLRELDRAVTGYDQRIRQLSEQHPLCRRLQRVEGVGPMTATAYVAAVGDARVFHNGRQAAAWLGLVPRHQASGGQTIYLGISKRGDRYLRQLLVHGARAVVYQAAGKTDPKSRWIHQLKARRGTNVAVVALANKNARTLWALMAKGEAYRHAA